MGKGPRGQIILKLFELWQITLIMSHLRIGNLTVSHRDLVIATAPDVSFCPVLASNGFRAVGGITNADGYIIFLTRGILCRRTQKGSKDGGGGAYNFV